MEDIIATVAWACGDNDCSAGWHQSNYWVHDDGTYSVDRYCDGDSEPVDADEVPTAGEVCESWLEYSRHVAATGCDPLGEFRGIPRTTKRKERYTAAFRPSILGGLLVAVRRGGKVVPLRDLPQRVIDYLDCERQPGAAGNLVFRDGWKALIGLECVKLYRGTARVTFTLDHEEPRPEAAVEADLRRAARRHLREKKAKA
jgi:hypothetical protein